jgi:cyclin G-associated kinase
LLTPPSNNATPTMGVPSAPNANHQIASQPSQHTPPARPQPPHIAASVSPLPVHRSAPPRPTELPRMQQNNSDIMQQQQQLNSNGGLFSSFKGGAGSFLKNLKDTSSKVCVQNTVYSTQ